jgi:hypothetical protein
MSPSAKRISRRNKIDDAELVRKIVLEKWTRSRCAAHFRVSPEAITRRLNLFGFPPARLADMPAADRNGSTVDAHRVAAFTGGLDVATRLQEIDAALVAELDFIRERGVGNADKREALIEKLLATLSELRKTAGTWIELSRAMASIAEISLFREIVLNTLSEEAPGVKAKVLARLAQARSGHRMLTPMLPAGEAS